MNDNMKISAAGLEFISKWEGCVLKPYKDIAGLRTIGVGHLIKPGENFPDGVEISKDQALSLLAADIEKCENSIKANINVPLNQNQFDALCSFGFNCGTGVYSKSGVAIALNASQYDQVPAKLLEWSKAKINGVLQVNQGLFNRRKSEGELFSKPVDASAPKFVIDSYAVPWDKTSLAAAQTMLKKLGLYTITVDGLWGPGTEKALKTFAIRCSVDLSDPSKGIPSSLLTELKKQSGS
jgi:lysozyme